MYACFSLLSATISRYRKMKDFPDTGREINKDIVAPKILSQIPVAREDCQILQTAFHRFKR